ncbi:hypothetical protein [Roseateles amylovorans]|uniref:Uncharacterized protein n=1 Tax=Roseateles amylovorans TaxID=2978473 RepID=A0ABY6B5W6_9BURK|nr:hypothetical protein [Roseateles amylovorans]UXH79718.1 hypothetical protein N4261_07365 [Roseateles amylovorans]
MSSEANDFFALPPFKADDALVQLRRALRDLQGLTERSGAYGFDGQEVLKLDTSDGRIIAKLARKPARSPEWDTRECSSAADVRKLQDDLKRRLAQWTDD